MKKLYMLIADGNDFDPPEGHHYLIGTTDYLHHLEERLLMFFHEERKDATFSINVNIVDEAIRSKLRIGGIAVTAQLYADSCGTIMVTVYLIQGAEPKPTLN